MPQKTKHYSTELLTKLGLLDTEPRSIKRLEKVKCKCKICEASGESLFNNILAKEGWHCKACSVSIQKSKVSKTYEEMYGTDKAKELKEKLKKSKNKTKREATLLERYGTANSFSIAGANAMHNEVSKKKLKETNLKKYGTEVASKSDAVKNKAKQTCLDKYGKANPVSDKIIAKRKETMIKNFGDHNMRTEEGQERLKQAMFAKHGVSNPMQNPNVVKKAMSSGRRNMTVPVKKFKEMLKNRRIKHECEYVFGDKSWDFGIFKDRELIALVEIDGEWSHGHKADPYVSTVAGHKDAERFQKTDGIKYIQCDSKKIDSAFQELMRIFDINYQEWIDTMVAHCLALPFPYPVYECERMLRDWKNLCNLQEYTKRVLVGNSIIMNFHKSVFSSNKKGKVSPIAAWDDKVLLEKCIRNRFIYCPSIDISSVHVARGFEKNQIAPRVSVFQPALARHILQKYSVGKSVVDPFSGFSGRMLGAASLGMDYRGFDIRAETVLESNEIINFLGLNGCTVTQGDILNYNDNLAYDTLITCPPYEDKEQWNGVESYKDADFYIDECMRRFSARVYIFVVDETTKYQKFIKEEVCNESHISSNKEKVLVITK